MSVVVDPVTVAVTSCRAVEQRAGSVWSGVLFLARSLRPGLCPWPQSRSQAADDCAWRLDGSVLPLGYSHVTLPGEWRLHKTQAAHASDSAADIPFGRVRE